MISKNHVRVKNDERCYFKWKLVEIFPEEIIL